MEASGTGAGRAKVARAQGAYWFAAGLWPLLHYPSFEAVAGPKKDDWLVRTMGGLIAVVGGTLFAAGLRRRVTDEVAALGALGALALGTADVVFAARGRISRIYLVDAALEAVTIGAWALSARSTGRVVPELPTPRPTEKLGELPA